jgi:hypothetical protein
MTNNTSDDIHDVVTIVKEEGHYFLDGIGKHRIFTILIIALLILGMTRIAKNIHKYKELF